MLQNQEIVILIHNCKNIILNHFDEFKKLLEKITSKTFKLKIVIVLTEQTNDMFKDDEKVITDTILPYGDYKYGEIEVKLLESKYAYKFLLSLD